MCSRHHQVVKIDDLSNRRPLTTTHDEQRESGGLLRDHIWGSDYPVLILAYAII